MQRLTPGEAGAGGPSANQADRESREQERRAARHSEREVLRAGAEESGRRPWRKSRFWTSCGRTTSSPTSAARTQRHGAGDRYAKATRRIGELNREITGLGTIKHGRHRGVRAGQRAATPTSPASGTTWRRPRTELQRRHRGASPAEMTAHLRPAVPAASTRAFSETFLELFGGGKATLELEDEDGHPELRHRDQGPASGQDARRPSPCCPAARRPLWPSPCTSPF